MEESISEDACGRLAVIPLTYISTLHQIISYVFFFFLYYSSDALYC